MLPSSTATVENCVAGSYNQDNALPLDCSSSGGEVGAVFTKRGKPEIPVGESTKVGSQVGW